MKKLSLVLLAKTDKPSTVANKFVCSDTKQTLYTNVSDEALSPFTGASFLKKSSKEVDLDKESVSTYKEVATCPSCETSWLASKDFIEANASFHCVVCNEQLSIDEKEVAPITEEISADGEDLDIIINDSEETAEEEEVAPEVVEIKEEVEAAAEECVDEVKAEDAPSEEKSDEEVVEVKEEEKVEANELEAPTVVIEINSPESVVVAPEELNAEELPEELTESLPEEAVNEQGFDIPEQIYTANLSYNLAHLLTKAEYKDKVELIASTLNKENPSFYIAVNSIPVAVAEFAKASDAVKAMFTDHDLVLRSLQVTLSNSSKEEGSLALKDFGIRAITTPIISETAAVASNVVKTTKALSTAFKKKEAEMFNIWRESFSTAALMFCKNLQKKNTTGKQKSLITKASITETLKAVGIQNAELIVEEAFKRGIQRDYGVIVEEALSLYSKTPEARKEVRDFVADAEYQASASLASDQATASKTQVVTKSVTHQANTSEVKSDGIGAIMASLREGIRSRAI